MIVAAAPLPPAHGVRLRIAAATSLPGSGG
jgi:hypothetical protein